MKSLIVLVAILALVACRQGISGVERMQMVDLFRTLQKSELGKGIFTTIELELFSSKQENIVDKIINNLEAMLQDAQDQKDKAISELGQKHGGCDGKQSELTDEINTLKDRIAQADLTFPTLQGQIDSKSTQLQTKKKEVNDANDRILALDGQAAEGKQKFEKTKDEHKNMIDVLNEAKKLISQLSAQKGAFLQQSSTIMAQIETHFTEAPKKLNKKHNKGLLTVLLNMAKQVGIQADQKQVAEILAIIDDLIAYEQKTMRIEFDAEQRRLSRYDFDRKRLIAQNEFFDAEIKDLSGDIKTFETRFKELKSDLAGWKQSIKAKTQQMEDMSKVCQNSIDYLERRKVDLTENYDLIRQVIALFRSKSIQDIREVVSDIKA